MTSQLHNPFETIESAQEFVKLLSHAISDAKQELEGDIQRRDGGNASRRADAIAIAVYSLAKLEGHMKQSNRILNDLRTLRRLLFEERAWALSEKNALADKPEWHGEGMETDSRAAA